MARWKVTETSVNGVLLLTNVAIRVKDSLTDACAGPVKVSTERTPLASNAFIKGAAVDELLEGGRGSVLDADDATGEPLGVREGSGEGDGDGDGEGDGEGDGDDVGGGVRTVTVITLLG